MKAGRRISLALALSLILFLPVAYADNTITLTSPNAQTGGDFGSSVAVSGTTVVVGAPLESAGTPAQPLAGHAYVFDASTGFLTPTTLTSPNAQIDGFFGSSVAVNEGDPIVVVGAPDESGGGSPAGGHAYVFF